MQAAPTAPAAIYTSSCSVKNLWQRYRIYKDHLEFSTLFGRVSIPFDKIDDFRVESSNVQGILKGDLKLNNFRPALKLDWANFVEHIVLDKYQGVIRRILFTPDDPEAFRAALDEALCQYRARKYQALLHGSSRH